MKPIASTLVALVTLLSSVPVGAQGNAADADKELQGVIREQENALRRLKALRARMERLKVRLEKEGKDHSASLLQKALEELTASGLETRMSDVTNKLKLNERLAGLSDAEHLVQKLQQILDLLLEKPDSSELDKKLDEMDKAIEGLKGLRDEQQQVRDDTAKIKNALTKEQKAALAESLKNLRA